MFFNVSECNEWYLFQFDQNIKESDKQFFGQNEGTTLLNDKNEAQNQK